MIKCSIEKLIGALPIIKGWFEMNWDAIYNSGSPSYFKGDVTPG